MGRLNLLLLIALVASSLVLVKAAYDTRRLRSEIHRAELELERLEGERKQYEAERRLQATTVRVDRTAREKLGMFTVTPAVTMYEMVAVPAPAQGGAR
jgi:cell division protein FtsL